MEIRSPDYVTISVSTYPKDLDLMDEKIAALKARGVRRPNRSALIRWLIGQLDVDTVPRDAFSR